jgi:hypothetical protein
VNGFGLRLEASPTAAPSRSNTLALDERVVADDAVGGQEGDDLVHGARVT